MANLEIPQGFLFAGTRCGLKNKRNDLGIIFSEHPTRSAAVFTQNQVRAACVNLSQKAIHSGDVRAIVVNSGNANCCTGRQGERDAESITVLAGKALGLPPQSIVEASTGVIGQLLDMAKVETGIYDAAKLLSRNPVPFMEAILTTDLIEKNAVDSVAGNAIVYGVAKGSGMIAPNMATMLCFLVSDADVSGIDLKSLVKRVADRTFNRCTVDGDTSTNDMMVVLANGASRVRATTEEFESAITNVADDLARKIARDGEGATKLVEIVVRGTKHPEKVARSIAESPLVKTAMFGCDPNWGRILMAAGKSGVPFDPNHLKLSLKASDETHVLFENGSPAAFDPQHVSAGLKSDCVIIELDFGEGESAILYTCDLGYGYVRINAEYHT